MPSRLRMTSPFFAVAGSIASQSRKLLYWSPRSPGALETAIWRRYLRAVGRPESDIAKMMNRATGAIHGRGLRAECHGLQPEVRMVDVAKCTGCKICLKACPWEMISFDPDTRKATKCHLCNGKPKCVEACPAESLSYVS